MSPSTDGPTPEIHEAAELVHRYLQPFVLPPADYRQQCTRECLAASARPRLSRLLLPQANASAHFFVRYGALCVRISETTSDHGVKGKLPDELFPRAILRLLLNQTRQLFLGRGHWRYLQFVLKGATDNHLMEWHLTSELTGASGWRAGCACKPRDRCVRRPVERFVSQQNDRT